MYPDKGAGGHALSQKDFVLATSVARALFKSNILPGPILGTQVSTGQALRNRLVAISLQIRATTLSSLG
jgi:hypothetical protein